MKKILMIIAPKDFRDEEYFIPKEKFEKSGFSVITASAEKGKCLGKLGGTANASMSLNEINTDDYDAVVFVGGGGSSVYFDDKKAHDIAKSFYRSGKVTSAICIAPMILVNSGVLTGKKGTVFPSEIDNMKNGGVIYTGKDVEVDGTIVTANGPAAAGAFAGKIIELLKASSVKL